MCRLTVFGIELSSADKIWQVILTLIVQTMKQEVFAVEAKHFDCHAESYYFRGRKLRDDTASRHIHEFIHLISCEILAYFENSEELCNKVVYKQLCGLVTINL